MIDFDKTFLEECPKIIKCSVEKLVPLKYGRILATVMDKSYSYRTTKALIFDKNFQLISSIKFKDIILDVIQLKTKKILFLFINYLFLYNLKSLKLVSEFKFSNGEGPAVERIFELSDSKMAFCYSASYGIDLYNNNLEFIKTIDTKWNSYSACEINNSNIAFNCTQNYKCNEYEIGFSHNDIFIKDLHLSTSRDSLYYFKKKYLIALGKRIAYIIDLDKYDLINEFFFEDQYFFNGIKNICLFNDYLLIPGNKYKIMIVKWNENNKKLVFVKTYCFNDSIKPEDYNEEIDLANNIFLEIWESLKILFINDKIYIYTIEDIIKSFNISFNK